MKVWAIIPAFREVQSIALVVAETAKYVSHVLVIDDASGDGTDEAARSAGAEVIVHSENKGKGGALCTAFERIQQELDVDAAVCLDGDGQHLAEEIPKFVEAAESEMAPDLVIGSRMASPEGMPFVRLWTNRVTSWCVSRAARARVRDSQSGFRLLRRDLMADLSFTTTRYDLESEMIIQAGRKGYTISEVPISTVYSDETSTIKPFADTLRFIRLMVRYR